ncbi:MAG TPA: beta-ketoacyl synthase N-terminal-like domain-containing protein [Polyangiaceae bacterium]
MSCIAVIAASALSALGEGTHAYSAGVIGEPAQSGIGHDAELARAGLRKPFAARVANAALADSSDRAGALILTAARALARELDVSMPDWRQRSLGVVIGTSGGGMPSLERVMADREAGRGLSPELARAAPYFGPLSELEHGLGVAPQRLTQVLAACASSTVAIGLGCRWIELDEAEIVIAGGYDAFSTFIASGFEALGATCSGQPQPFRAERDGMVLGEGAALVALVRAEHCPVRALGYVHGFGAASDAVHITAPDREGGGLRRAAALALRDAQLDAERVGLVSAHGTATPYNDSAEANALRALLGPHAEQVVVQPFKAQIGHTLGAAGALESLSALDALGRSVLPAARGSGAVDPGFSGRLLDVAQLGTASFCLKLSAAFGGANAALVLGREPLPSCRRVRAPVRVLSRGEVVTEFDMARVAASSNTASAKLSRLDANSALAVTAAASALAQLPVQVASERMGIVVGTMAATLEVNELYDRRRRAGRAVEPKRFPPTSPNLAPGECSIVFELRGPAWAVGAGPAAPIEALLVACDLLDGGDADAVLVVCADQVEDVVRDTWTAAGWPVPEHGASAVVLGRGPAGPLLSRQQLCRAHADAVREQGVFAGSAPGWPAFSAALDSALSP